MNLPSPRRSFPPVARPDECIAVEARRLVDGKAKPPGSLGRIEGLAVRLAGILGTVEPRLDRATLLLFAGDHGLVDDGVSRYPSAVTAAMVSTLLAGRASANAFAAVIGVDLVVVDAGVAGDLPAGGGLRREKIRRGTANAAREPAMTRDEAEAALAMGVRLAREAIAAGADAILLGEMGIGNTASAALLAHRLAPAPLDTCVGPGAGQDEAGLARKLSILRKAASRTATTDPFSVLAEFGGCEIAAMAGAAIGAASASRPVVVDGFIASAAALVAVRLVPAVGEFCILAHRSAEPGHDAILRALGHTPLLDLGLRLGEGTGALLALPLLRAAARLLSDVASLDEVLAHAG